MLQKEINISNEIYDALFSYLLDRMAVYLYTHGAFEKIKFYQISNLVGSV